MENFRAGSLIIRDLGYFSVDGLNKMAENKLFYLSRLQPKTALFRYSRNSWDRIDLVNLLEGMKKKNLSYLEKDLYITHAKLPTRVCFFLVPDQVREKRIRDARKYVESRGWKMSKEFEVWASINAYITNVDNIKLPIKNIKEIYKIRWQIELVFKTWKSYYRIQCYKSMKIERIECYLYASLLKILVHWNIRNIARRCVFKLKKNISFTKFIKVIISIQNLIFETIKNVKSNIRNLMDLLARKGENLLVIEHKSR